MSELLSAALRRPSDQVAPWLLGQRISSDSNEGRVTIELTEVEAYAGLADPASHAFRGRTPRTEVMFGPAGRLYLYFTYGMHWCANVVTGRDGEASAVLLRAGKVVEGVELASRRRGDRAAYVALARGPACLTSALGLAREHNGTDLLQGGSVRLEASQPRPVTVATGPRVGVSAAADVTWRFWIAGDETVSTYRRSKRAGTPDAPALNRSPPPSGTAH
ncbi:MAG TPA: DNA-3-methyladenine glycosylase [Nocardioidaceae bacterium]|nr:DNA-3-methyladenine glycosylase [Nocardioidaceae bacterium]